MRLFLLGNAACCARRVKADRGGSVSCCAAGTTARNLLELASVSATWRSAQDAPPAAKGNSEHSNFAGTKYSGLFEIRRNAIFEISDERTVRE
jgi:hypothetical protein